MTPENVALAKEVRDAEKLAEMKAAFDAKFKENMTNKTRKNVKFLENKQYEEKIQRLGELKNNLEYKWVPEDYVLAKNHKVMDMVREDNTTIKTLVKIDQKTGNKKRYVTVENLFDAIHEDHTKRVKHTGRLLTYKYLCHRYANVTMEQVICYLDLCETCALKKGKAKKGVVVKPIVSSHMGSRAQVALMEFVVLFSCRALFNYFSIIFHHNVYLKVDYIDMQSNPDGEYKWIMVYEDHLTKYCIVLPGKTKTAEETAEKLKFIFSILAAPVILQSDNGREFVNQVI